MSYFRKVLWHLSSTKLKFSTTFYLKTDGQIEVVNDNKSLKNLLRTLIGEHIETWDLKLATAEFAYNATVNRTIDKSPHEIVYDFRPRQPIDLIPMSDHVKVASHVHDLHKEVMNKIAQSKANYKLRVDIRKK